MNKTLFRTVVLNFIFIIALCGETFSQNSIVNQPVSLKIHPVYPPDTKDLEKLRRSVEPIMQMSIEEVIAQVPTASGIFYVGCPNCNGGAQEDGVLSWKPGMEGKVVCNFCKMVFPNEKFPNNGEKVIIAPSGAKQIYRYYENSEGR